MAATPESRPPPGGPISARLVLQEGLFAGVAAGVAVAGLFLVADLAAGQPLRTPSVLGTLLFQGPEAARVAPPNLPIALAYNGIHFLLWLAAGFGAAWLTLLLERNPAIWYLPFSGAAFLLVAFFALDAALLDSGLGRLRLWAGGVLGAAVMGAVLLRRHPGAWRRAGTVWKE